MPSGIAISSQTRRPPATSDRVTGVAWTSLVVTFSRVPYDRPRSPWRTNRQTKWAYSPKRPPWSRYSGGARRANRESFLVMVGLSVHPVLLGLVLSYLFGHRLNVLPARGYCSVNNISTGCDGLARWAEHLVLPWITFGVVNAALFTMMIRALVIEELSEEYVRTARAKGAGQGRIVRAHLLRNVTLPLVTMVGVQAATSLGGVIFIESVFDLPGLGGMLRRGAQQRDLPLTAGSVLFLALAIMTLNLLVDLFYGILDPRIRTAALTAVG